MNFRPASINLEKTLDFQSGEVYKVVSSFVTRKEKFLIILILLTALLLRVVGQGISPPGFTSDEGAFGYNAYSILLTGKDQFGEKFPIAFRAFGDYRPPLYIYLTVPFIKLFGLTVFATRAVSIISGILMILITYLLGKKIFNTSTGLVAALFLSFCPWHLLLTRYADMAPLAALFQSLGVLFFLIWIRKQKIGFIIISGICFVLSVYSYHNSRLTGLILLFILGFMFFKRIQGVKQIIIALTLSIVFLSPLFLLLLNNPDKILRRGFNESIFKRGLVNMELWNDVRVDNPNQPPLLTRFFHNKPVYFTKTLLKQYFSHLDFNYIFIGGDTHDRFNLPLNGLIFVGFMPFLVIGIYYIVKSHQKLWLFPLLWLLTSPIISSIGIFVPNSLHTFDSVVPFSLITAFGIVNLQQKIVGKKIKIIFLISLIIVFISGLFNFIKGYFYLLPKEIALLRYWNYSKGHLVEVLTKLEDKYPKIIFIGGHYDIDLLFFKRYDPRLFQSEFRAGTEIDENGFQLLDSFNKYFFLKNYQPAEDVLYVDDGRSLIDKYCWTQQDCKLKVNPQATDKIYLEKIYEDYFPDGSVNFRVFYAPEDNLAAKINYCRELN